MNHPVWDIPFLGSGWIIGIISIIHVSIAHLVVGGGIWLAIMEGRAQKAQDPDFLQWLRDRAKALLWLSSIFGAGTGVGIWVAIGLVNPTATQHLIRAFVMGWATEWLLFIGEMATLIVFVRAYDRLRPRQRLILAWLYALCAWLSLVVINGIITFMLSPGKGWAETHLMWDGFFNPTYLPSLLLRTFVALALGGLWALAAAAQVEDEALKPRLLTPTGWLTLTGVLLSPLAGWYYFRQFPAAARELILGNLQGQTGLAQGLHWSLWGFAAFLVPAFLALWAMLAPGRFWRPAALAGLFLACWGFGGFEWIREVARKPFAIREVMYSNGIRVDQVAGYQKDGFLPNNAWAQAFATSKGDTELARGEALFRSQCMACHTREGYRGLKGLTAKYTAEDTVLLIQGLREMDPGMNPYLDRMPPFAGTEQEAGWLGKYLASLNPK
jgi:cytochrome c553